MGDVITRFKLETSQFDSKLRDTAKALQGIAHQAEMGGKDFNNFSQKAIESARALGTVQSGANNTKDKLRDLVGSYNDAAKAYNSLTETAKKGEFGQAMSQSLTQLQQRIRETKQELYGLGGGMKGASGGSLFSSDKLSGMLQVFGGNLMTKGAGMVMSFAGELKDMVAQGIELAKAGEGVRLAFQRLGRGDILQGLREATHGTVTDLELMKAAVKFNDFKLPLDELGTMLAFAQQKAKDTGQSVDYMVDSIVTGLGRKSLMILDNLGLSASEVKERMAETGDMTKAVGAIIREQMAKAGDYVETAADRATQANVSLQNKMEELGRKFAPVEEASNHLWTSIKIGILDIVGGPLERLLNGLTEAGRLKNMLDDMNGGGNGKETQTEKALRLLRQYSGGGRGIEGKRDLYNRQVASFSRQEENAWREANRLREELNGLRRQQKENGLAGNLQPLISDTSRKLEAAENRAKALQIVRANYEAGAKPILEGNRVTSPTSTTTTPPTGGTTTKQQTPQERAQESFTKAEQNYKQALEKAAMELEAGSINMAQAKQQKAQAAEQRWKAIGDARNINDSENLRKAQNEAAAEYKRLAAEAKTATERQKAVDKATRDLENANQKLATARSEMAQARQHGDLQAYNTAKDKATAAQKEITRLEKVKVDVERGKVDLPDIPKVIEQTVNTHQGEMMTAEIAKEITQTINTRLGRIVTPDILESITQTINTRLGRIVTPDILESITQTINTKIGKVVTPAIAKELTQEVNVKTGKVDLKPIPTEITQKVDVEQGDVNLPAIPAEVTQTVDVETGRVNLLNIPEVIEQTVNTHQGEMMTAEIAKEITQTINTRLGRIVTPDILESITQTINTKIGRVVTPDIAKELTQEVNVKTGKVDLKPIPTELTQKVDVEQGDVNLPAIPAEVTQTVDVETGRVNLLNIPEVIEQTVNTHQGELMTADIATEITQKINTVLGNIVKPEILDEVTQTINTKVGEIITPEIAKEVTQVVNVETGTVDLEPIPTETTTKVIFQADTRNINAAISDVKKEIATIPVGTIKFNLDQTTLVDLTTLKTLIDEQVKNGLEIDPEATQGLFSKIQLGIDIEDTTWQDLIDKINEKLKDLGLDPIKLDLKTGETSKKGRGREKKNPYIQTDEKGNEKASLAGVMGGMATGMSEMVSGMENLGIEIPKGFKDTISAVQGVVSILNSIVVIVQAIEAISAIDSIIPFAHGGVVKAANGYVSGTTYSGDQIPAMLNAGEVVLNRGQQGVLAASLQAVGQSGEGGGGGRPYVSGELIWLGLNNYLNRSGRGEIVTSKRR